MSDSPSPSPSPLVVPPPFPAPYLAGAAEVPDDLLAQIDGRKTTQPADRRAFQTALRRVTRDLRHRRSSYEASQGVQIAPERPFAG